MIRRRVAAITFWEITTRWSTEQHARSPLPSSPAAKMIARRAATLRASRRMCVRNTTNFKVARQSSTLLRNVQRSLVHMLFDSTYTQSPVLSLAQRDSNEQIAARCVISYYLVQRDCTKCEEKPREYSAWLISDYYSLRSWVILANDIFISSNKFRLNGIS